jgi:hypothetical protein
MMALFATRWRNIFTNRQTVIQVIGVDAAAQTPKIASQRMTRL